MAASRQGTITITFGDASISHIGMTPVDCGTGVNRGFSYQELESALHKLGSSGLGAELVDLRQVLPERLQEIAEPAYLLIARGAIGHLFESATAADALWDEIRQLPFDTKYLDPRRQKVLNKHSQYQICLADVGRAADYEKGLGTVVSFDILPYASEVRHLLPKLLGPLAENLVAETNYYYDTSKCGIGFHGDTERHVVVGVRLGETLPLVYQWYYGKDKVGDLYRTTFDHGDLYVMSAKTVGRDWLTSGLTLRHAAGCAKFTGSRDPIENL